ncbi:motility associated factor glycosyltransferase family protein [Spirochaeta dissipatitropha]
MPEILEKNRRMYRERFPAHPLQIPEHLPENAALIQTASGFPSIEIDKRLMHSKYNPKKEAERLLGSRKILEDEWIILFGFGMGYTALELCRQFPDHSLYIIDPDPTGFFAAFHYIDLEDLFGHRDLTLLIGLDAPPGDSVMGDIQYKQLHIIRHKPSVDRNIEFFHGTEQRLQRLLQRRKVNHNTLKRFGKLWLRNFTANIKINCSAAAVQLAEHKFTGIPGLLVAAGPGLNDILPQLVKLRNHCLIAAVDTALPILLQEGIDPDIVVVVDPQYWNTRHVDYCRNSNAIVVSESSAHPRVFRCLNGPFLFGDSLFPLGKFLEDCFGSRGKLGAGGSVATSAFEVLKLFGCTEIFCAGLDLGFPSGATHCRGSFFEERVHCLSTRYQTAEHLLWRYLVDGGKIPAIDYDGEPLQTDARMQVYQQWFSMQLIQNPDIHLHPLSRKGLKIDGAEPADWQDLLQREAARAYIDKNLKEIRAAAEAYSEKTPDNAGVLHSRIQTFLGSMHEIRKIAAEALRHIGKNWDQPESWNQNWITKLNTYDSQLREHEAKDVTGFLLQEALEEIQSEAIPGRHPLDSSKTLYSAICDSADYQIRLLERMLVNLDMIREEQQSAVGELDSAPS